MIISVTEPLLKQNIKKEWFVYIVECSDKSLYTGITNNLENRIKTHNKGKGAKYTRARRPVVLKYYETASDKSSASKREIALKNLSRSQKIKLINFQNNHQNI
ncbi:MAG: GIY-YIG nuclease family protein [Candidatus Riflebacteria bacterium]|nr:GIY-YIG nuclease family protein [Candidatus Riflebacteria bacterium]